MKKFNSNLGHAFYFVAVCFGRVVALDHLETNWLAQEHIFICPNKKWTWTHFTHVRQYLQMTFSKKNDLSNEFKCRKFVFKVNSIKYLNGKCDRRAQTTTEHRIYTKWSGFLLWQIVKRSQRKLHTVRCTATAVKLEIILKW